ncbi:hypothetical protein ORI20_04965 [Mycobacterium sp. CVI_P3]|uniref:Uncharacterized protein n=1 Tax=Mycobacterium pinniadriaticum TaxID=2994102 RepID=A0ABT3S958_9MYCO|nr:hypothetical protein [Mycobacterium pinniadriaticum]MCX2929614.1 hypothetical protein [Mycobacterium pinniadriaticum]MCX2936038.1 hypothetical protein [Mycobacterium pinniadriaticum]
MAVTPLASWSATALLSPPLPKVPQVMTEPSFFSAAKANQFRHSNRVRPGLAGGMVVLVTAAATRETVDVLGAGSVVLDSLTALGRGLSDPVARTVAAVMVTGCCVVAADDSATLETPTAAAADPGSGGVWVSVWTFADPRILIVEARPLRGPADAVAFAELVVWRAEAVCVWPDPVSAWATAEPLASAAPTPIVITPAPSQT